MCREGSNQTSNCKIHFIALPIPGGEEKRNKIQRAKAYRKRTLGSSRCLDREKIVCNIGGSKINLRKNQPPIVRQSSATEVQKSTSDCIRSLSLNTNNLQ
ncbi:hypothetical protein PROFUN_15536 [Planoprotostelium fungivorum]|uniref:Uncharacterized protein n=1 Tax=Planoprotostelium fungivorum TaxID=1890364 RepID=A0A2P6MUP4_9EUKA|nr:hypothetical protein PROFUN_15536 [Planoprotostelium fungivorum]